MLEDLSHYIYVKSSNDVLQWKRAATAQPPFQRASSGRNSSGRASGNMITKNDAPKVKSLMLEIVGSSQKYILNSRNEKIGLLIIIHFFSLQKSTNLFHRSRKIYMDDARILQRFFIFIVK